jgi:hypothetical protein
VIPGLIGLFDPLLMGLLNHPGVVLLNLLLILLFPLISDILVLSYSSSWARTLHRVVILKVLRCCSLLLSGSHPILSSVDIGSRVSHEDHVERVIDRFDDIGLVAFIFTPWELFLGRSVGEYFLEVFLAILSLSGPFKLVVVAWLL